MQRFALISLSLLVATLFACRAQPELQPVTPGDQGMANTVQEVGGTGQAPNSQELGETGQVSNGQEDVPSAANQGADEPPQSTSTEPVDEAELTGPPAQGNSESAAVAFSAYPKLHRLCEQRVYAGPGSDIREIHWTLDASTDELEQVLAHYRALSGQTESSGEDGVRFDFGNGLRVAVFSRAQRKAHPSCEVEPSENDRSLVLTSQAR